jgi:hypothetical protein
VNHKHSAKRQAYLDGLFSLFVRAWKAAGGPKDFPNFDRWSKDYETRIFADRQISAKAKGEKE